MPSGAGVTVNTKVPWERRNLDPARFDDWLLGRGKKNSIIKRSTYFLRRHPGNPAGKDACAPREFPKEPSMRQNDIRRKIRLLTRAALYLSATLIIFTFRPQTHF